LTARATPAGFDTTTTTAGCTPDGQNGTANTDAGYALDVGSMVLVGGVAVPKCVAGLAVNVDGKAPVKPLASTPGDPLVLVPDVNITDTSSITEMSTFPVPDTSGKPPPAAPAEQSQPGGAGTPEAPLAPVVDMGADQRRRLRLANQMAGLNLAYYEARSCC
jgi:hypothetical protein